MGTSLLLCFYFILLREALCGGNDILHRHWHSALSTCAGRYCLRQQFAPDIPSSFFHRHLVPSICSRKPSLRFSQIVCSEKKTAELSPMASAESEWTDPFKWEDEANEWNSDSAMAALEGANVLGINLASLPLANIIGKMSFGGAVRRARGIAEYARVKAAEESQNYKTVKNVGPWKSVAKLWEAAATSAEAAQEAGNWAADGARTIAVAAEQTAQLAAAAASLKAEEGEMYKAEARNVKLNEEESDLVKQKAGKLEIQQKICENRVKEWKAAAEAWREAATSWETVVRKRGDAEAVLSRADEKVEARDMQAAMQADAMVDDKTKAELDKRRKDQAKVDAIAEEYERAQKEEKTRGPPDLPFPTFEKLPTLPPSSEELLAESSLNFSSIPAVALIGVLVGSALTTLRLCRSASTVGKEPILAL